MPGREVVIDWHGRRAHAWVPGPLAKSSLVLSEPTVRRTEQAAASARRVTDALPPGWAPLARLLLRTEGVASSSIEGIRAPLSDVAAAEVDPSSGEAAGWVANNLAVVTAAAAAGRAELLTTERVQDWHGRLMEGPHGWLPPEMVGAFRTVQGWIGGTSPLDAVLMTPPPEFVPDLMDDLLAYVNRDDVDAVTQAAVAHAQFESIHPYADGNGRIGRVLVAWILVRRLELAVPPPVSVLIATNRGGYLSGLTRYRLGETDPWVRWFAGVVADASDATLGLLDRVHALTDEWSTRLRDVRADAAAQRLVVLLPQHPVTSATTVAAQLGVSERAARTALSTLASHHILEPYSPAHTAIGRPRSWWVAAELLALVARWAGD